MITIFHELVLDFSPVHTVDIPLLPSPLLSLPPLPPLTSSPISLPCTALLQPCRHSGCFLEHLRQTLTSGPLHLLPPVLVLDMGIVCSLTSSVLGSHITFPWSLLWTHHLKLYHSPTPIQDILYSFFSALFFSKERYDHPTHSGKCLFLSISPVEVP